MSKNTIVFVIILFPFLIWSCNKQSSNKSAQQKNKENKSMSSKDNKENKKTVKPVIVIHGGAGSIKKKNLSKKEQKKYEEVLETALNTGYKHLNEGGSSIDAVKYAINVMEDSPLFNAGKGAVFTHDEKNEMDASIMDGNTLNAGAVAGISTVKNPINAAKIVMDSSKHVMLARKGAEEYAEKMGLKIVDPEYFKVQSRLESLRKMKKRNEEETELDHGENEGYTPDADITNDKHGTVGAVALDKKGDLAAATSTGGMTNKKYARIGDSPIIGAGTYADNKTCAISCTGHGEYFMRLCVAHNISTMMQYKNVSLKKAANKVIHEQLENLGGEGGIIGVDKNGTPYYTFNTDGMFRAKMLPNGEKDIKMFGD